MMARVVFDTSSLIGAAIKVGSKPNLALIHSLESCNVYASEELMAELHESLARERFNRYLSTIEKKKFLDFVRENFKIIPILDSDVAGVDPACRDPTDNYVLALAWIAKADILISSDHDLLALHPWCGIPILTPAQFLERFRESGES